MHGDLYGPIASATPSRSRYFLLLIGNLSRFMWITLLRGKDEVLVAIRQFHVLVEVRPQLCALRADQGGEFTSLELSEYYADRDV